MNYNQSIKHSAGIGLIEVLVATVVVAVGLLAVGSLQGDLLGNSRGNKTRGECQSLANSQMERLRDSLTKANYDALISSTANQSVVGVTETFSRGWVVTNQTNPTRKQITVNVSWGSGGADEQCAVQSVVAYDDVGNSVLATGQGSGGGANNIAVGGPSTNAESSDQITENINLPPGTTYTAGALYTTNGKTYIVQDSLTKASRAFDCADASLALSSFENGLYTRRVDYDNVTGNEAIYLYESATVGGTLYCIPRVRFNGGVMIPIRGIVHSGVNTGTNNNPVYLDVNLFTFNASESGAFCVFNPGAGVKSAPYVCYVGGNCKYGPAGATTAVTECPNPAVASAKVGPGGWRGKVGLLGVAAQGAQGRNVCFSEEIGGTPLTLDTARNYYTRNAGLNEGLNRPYSCHDFLIIDGRSTNKAVHDECVKQANAIGGFSLASKTIQRDISGNNVFDPITNVDFCGAIGTNYTITGTITNANSPPTVKVTDGISINPCTATSTSYTCLIKTALTSVTISGLYVAETQTCTVSSLSSSSPSPSGCALNFTATSNPTYTVNGYVNGTSTATAAVSLTMSGGGTCTVNSTYDTVNLRRTYSCLLTTLASTASATITPSVTVYGTVTPDTAQTVLLPGTTQTLPGSDFTATDVATYTISGTISIDSGVGELETNTSPKKTYLASVTAAVDTGTCSLTGTHVEGTSDSYSCTVPAGANRLSITLSSMCTTTGNGGKKYEMVSGTTSTLGTGTLVIDLGTVGANATKNITVSKSNTNC